MNKIVVMNQTTAYYVFQIMQEQDLEARRRLLQQVPHHMQTHVRGCVERLWSARPKRITAGKEENSESGVSGRISNTATLSHGWDSEC